MKEITLEFIFNSSPGVLFNRLSTPSGLAEWFCDDVKVDRQGTYHFEWDGAEELAELVRKKDGDFVLFKWIDRDDEPTFEFRLKRDPMTRDLALIVTDHIDEDEEDETRLLWESQIGELKRILGN
ncbi:MAG: hypothetical protein ACI85F_000775 [Bacteroidia bacterium]|jgi:uncharacterized protein YndB with AHSA1/START domain